MFNRLKVLTKMQLQNMEKKKSVGNLAISISVRALICVAVTAVLYFLLNLIKNMVILPVDTNFFMFLLFITQAISVLSCVFGLTKVLYMSKDNSVIFTMPAHPSEIFISRLLVFYISEFKRNLTFIIPFCIAFGIVLKLDVLFFLTVILMVFILPLLPVLIGAIMSLPLMYIKKFLNRFPIVKILIALAVIAVVVWLLIVITGFIPRPLRIVAIYGQFFEFVKNAIITVNGFATIYSCIANFMIGVNAGINVLIVLGSILVLSGLTYVITLVYFNIASQSSEHSFKVRKEGQNKPCKTTFLTFVKKELIINLRNTGAFIGHIIFIVSLPVLLFVVNEIISAIDMNLQGIAIAFVVNLLIGLMFLTSSNTISAGAITSEGSEFGLIKTAPSDTSKICYAKLVVNFALSFVGILATIIVLAFTSQFNAVTLIILFFTFLFVNTAHMFWALQIDLLKPKLAEYSTRGNIHDSKNIGRSLLIGFAISVIVAAIGYFCFSGMEIINMLKLLLIAGLFFVLRVYLFHLNLKVYFDKIQM